MMVMIATFGRLLGHTEQMTSGWDRLGTSLRALRSYALTAAVLAGAAAWPGPAQAKTSPPHPAPLVLTGAKGRVTVGFGPDKANPSGDGVVMAADQVGALRGGGVLLGDNYRLGAKELDLVALKADGSLRRSFGDGGLLQVPGLGLYSVIKIVGEPDGGALVLAVNQNKVSGPDPVALVRVSATGGLDGAFAGGGVDRLAGLSGPADVALQPDGSIVLASTANANTTNPGVVVTRLSADGAPMPEFGSGGSVSLSPADEQAVAVAVAPGGDILVLGNPVKLGQPIMLAALTQSGALDTSFNGGVPIVTGADAASSLPQSADQQLLIQPSGRIELLYSPTKVYFTEPAVSHELFIAAYTSAGAPDTSFGDAGTLELTLGEEVGLPAGEVPGTVASLLPASGEDTLALLPTGSDRPKVVRLLADGQPDPSFGGAAGEALNLGFGGLTTGDSASGGDDFGETAAELENGTIVLPGTVELAFFNGGGSGNSNTFVTHDAVGALTAELQRDAAFGENYAPLHMKVRLSGVRKHSVVVRLAPSQAAAASVRVTAGGTLIANGSKILLYDERSRQHAIPLTRSGARRLRRGGKVRVRITVTATALDGQTRTFRVVSTMIP
jgi:uncharacterized delta-60 repeat protein